MILTFTWFTFRSREEALSDIAAIQLVSIGLHVNEEDVDDFSRWADSLKKEKGRRLEQSYWNDFT